MKSTKLPTLKKTTVALTVASALFLTACAGPSTADKNSEGSKHNLEVSKRSAPVSHEPKSPVPAKMSPEQVSQSQLIQVKGARQRQEESKRIMVLHDVRAETDLIGAVSLQTIASSPELYLPNNESYEAPEINSVKLTSTEPVSTFSVDVDTGSYTNARRMLTQGYLPPAESIRIEEFINYFDYNYEAPDDLRQPFSVKTNIVAAPWNKERHLLRIALKGYQPDLAESEGSNLVFLLDVSGSMNQSNKLPLLKRSLTMLSKQLNANDKVSIVVYAGASGVVLKPTAGNNTAEITKALATLQAGGSTNGAAGIEQAYELAEQAFIKGGVNRVILATDGDFNVGLHDHDELIKLIEKKREKGIALTTLGFGQGNYNDHLMEQLADAGNGNYAYIDSINEARKVLVDELQSTMQIIAKDVKVQVEFNPETVAEYRLIGYENRHLANEDFNNDKVDAGDIGAGHKVTALYEITLQSSQAKFNDTLRYSNNEGVKDKSDKELAEELAYVKLRYKKPNEERSKLLETAILKNDIQPFVSQSEDFKFATAVASFAQRLKASKYAGDISYSWILETAQEAKGSDEFGYRSEFIQLVRNAEQLANTNRSESRDNSVNETSNAP